MNFEKIMCDRLGYKYKYVFENVLYAIHHLPYAKEYINEETLKLLEELNKEKIQEEAKEEGQTTIFDFIGE